MCVLTVLTGHDHILSVNKSYRNAQHYQQTNYKLSKSQFSLESFISDDFSRKRNFRVEVKNFHLDREHIRGE